MVLGLEALECGHEGVLTENDTIQEHLLQQLEDLSKSLYFRLIFRRKRGLTLAKDRPEYVATTIVFLVEMKVHG